MTKLLIVNADDLGGSGEWNRAIVAASRFGLVRSASLMVNMPAAAAAVRLANSEPGLEVGLHLNATEGSCVAPARRLSLLADAHGRFRFDAADPGASLSRLRHEIDDKPAVVGQLIFEFEHQIERFRRFGLTLAHLDAHHYLPLIHLRLYEAYLRLAETHGVPCRGICEPVLSWLDPAASTRREMEAVSHRSEVPSPTFSLSHLWESNASREDGAAASCRYRAQVEQVLAKLAAQDEISAVELIVHLAAAPSECRPSGDDQYASVRELETGLVHSEEFRHRIAELGYSLGNYSALSGRR